MYYLAITFCLLATGDSYQSCLYLFKVSKQSAIELVLAVCSAIMNCCIVRGDA